MTTARAQVSPDGTLSTTVTNPDNLNFTINDGNRVGGNLFHSFREFSVPNGGSAVFQNAADVQNIISRVTGGSLSQINGLIQAQGSANLFLLNPAGISFGQNARLSIGGSFFATTADSLLFGDGIEFSATNPQAPLLTVNIPIGLRFRDNPGNITNQSVVQDNTNSPVGLQVNPGNSLALVGGNVSLEQGGRLTAAGGRIELGGLAGAGTVGLETNGNTFRLNFPANGLSNVSLLDDARVAVRSNGGGDIAVNTNIFTATNGGRLVGGIEGIATRNGGDITVNSNEFNISGVGLQSGLGAQIAQQVVDGASGNAGNIFVKTKSFNASSGAQLQNTVLSRGTGNAGNISITSNSLSLTNAQIDASVLSEANGNAGNIFINAGSIFTDDALLRARNEGNGSAGNISLQVGDAIALTNGTQISSSISGTGNAGNITVQASGTVRIAGRDSDGNRSGIFSDVLSGASGNAGNIFINAGSIFTDDALLRARNQGNGSAGNISLQVGDAIALTNGTQISSSISGTGNAGDVTLRAENGDISFAGGSDIFSTVESGGMGNAGKIDIITRNLSLTDGAQLQTLVRAGQQGDAGNITVQASGTVRIAGRDSDGNRSGIFSEVESGASGNAGNIFINAGSIFTDDALLRARNQGNGSAGNISLQVGDAIALTNGTQISSSISGTGNAGNVTLRAENGDISLAGDSDIFNTVGSGGTGNAGDVTLRAENGDISFAGGSDIFSTVGSGGMGNAGKIDIITRNLSLTDGAQLQTLVRAGQQSNAGNITVQASGTVRIAGRQPDGIRSGIFSEVESEASGNAGNITINANSIFTDDALLRARNEGNGSAGNISLQVGDAIALTNGTQISSSIFGTGNAGNVTLRAENGDISLAGGSDIFSTVGSGGTGNAGGIDITTGTLSLKNGASLSVITSGMGDAGIVKIQASDISFDGVGSTGFSSGIFSTVQGDAVGNAGGIDISTGTLSLFNGAIINASTFATGDAGIVKIQASDSIFASGVGSNTVTSGIRSNVQQNAIGNAGGIEISTKNLFFSNGAQIIANTLSNGNAGNVTISASDRVSFAGVNSGIFANTASDSTGNGGNITIQPLQNSFPTIAISDGGEVTVDSQGQGQGGNLSITGNNLTLDRGIINASTQSADGGNINLNLRNFIRLRNESLISANARGEQSGDGGNITINTPFIVAFPQNNDITANAVSGDGGRVSINRSAILFGIAPLRRADLQRLLGDNNLDPRRLPTSDITAFSEQNSNFPDNVQVTSPDIDPSRGLVELPETVTDTTQQVAQNPCRQGLGNEFVVTGRGGLPTTPNEILSSNNVRVDLLQPVASSGNSGSVTKKPVTTVTARRVPAQGWIFNDKGQVVLTAYDPTNTGSQRPFSTAGCPAR
ncbi:MAG: filamentous hemagglutinin N-terminal domain-containing protein [Tolypothrix brevis GSE-NOS-MK-07-07A]|jgi:filamentous hemagglutinin family protein|nr:filamentous hemagglutinin N-terminal domain-containing protein [Tolypothrix brevis GSE-NOS-MK-07-07A]